MAQHRQSGTDRFSSRIHIDSAIPGDQINIQNPKKPYRIRRSNPHRLLSSSSMAIGSTLVFIFFLSIVSFHRLSPFQGIEEYGVKNRSKMEVRFGQFNGGSGRDSRYWDRDDRRRDDDYGEEDVNGRNLGNDSGKRTVFRALGKRGNWRLYDEGGRKELDSYRRKYEDSLKNGRMEEANFFDEYDDGFDEGDEHEDLREEGENWDHSGDEIRRSSDAASGRKGALSNSNVVRRSEMDGGDGVGGGDRESSSGLGKKIELKRKSKHHKLSRE